MCPNTQQCIASRTVVYIHLATLIRRERESKKTQEPADKPSRTHAQPHKVQSQTAHAMQHKPAQHNEHINNTHDTLIH